MRHSVRSTGSRPFLAAALSVTALLVLVFLIRNWPQALPYKIAVRMVPYLGAFFAGLLNGRWSGGGGWRNGLYAGAVAGATLLYLQGEGNAAMGSLLRLAAVAIVGCIGGVVGVNVGRR